MKCRFGLRAYQAATCSDVFAEQLNLASLPLHQPNHEDEVSSKHLHVIPKRA